MMDREGNILQENLFENISIKEHGNIPWMIENDRIVLGDGTGKGQPSHYDVHFVSKESLEYLDGFKYEFQNPLDQLFVTGLVAYDNYYVLSGITQLKDTTIYPDFLAWIDKETMTLDTTIEYPFEKESVIPEFTFTGADSMLTVYFSGIGLLTDSLNQSFQSRGFYKIDKNKKIVFNYLDTIDLSTNHSYPHSGLLLENGNMIYKQRYNLFEQPWPYLWNSDFDILCINPSGEIEWRFNKPGYSFTAELGFVGEKNILHMSETANGDILACGYTQWHYNYPTIFEFNPFTDTLPPFPDSLEIYEAPYIIKIDGETGEYMWQYSIIEYDEYGNVLPYALRQIHELSDGSLIGTGWSKIRNENGTFIKNHSWAIRLPADGCIEDEGMECGFESYIPTSIYEPILIDMMEDRPFVVYPNPSNGIYRIHDKREVKSKIIVEIYQLDGTLVYSTDTSSFAEVDLTEYEGKLFICQIKDAKGKLLQTDKLVKW